MRRLRPPEAPREERPDDSRTLDGVHVALRNLLSDGRIGQDVYYKNVVGLAMRWIAIGRVEDATGMVCELSPDYIRHTMPLQMQVDDSFRKIALGVARHLAQSPLEMDEDDVALAVMLLEKPVAKA